MEIATTAEQRKEAKTAALKNYWDKVNCPDRPGWTGGKCPVTEYFGKVAELGAANFLGYDWHKLCLFSTNPADYTRADIDDWEVKAGGTFSKKDIAKGAQRILWVTPLNNGHVFYCGYDTCGSKVHVTLSGQVLVRGWTDVADAHLCEDMGGYYRVTEAAMQSPEELMGVAA